MIYKLGIDVSTKDGVKLLKRLAKLKSTVDVSGPFPYREDSNYAQLLLDTTQTESMVEDWLYKVKHGCDYVGVFTINDGSPIQSVV